MLTNVHPAENLRGLARRKARPDEFKSVRHPLVEEEEKNGWVVAQRNKSSTRLRKPKTHNNLLEDRVWTLLYRMGFTHLSGDRGANLLMNSEEQSGPRNQLDVVAFDDDVALAIECKSSAKATKPADFAKDLGKLVSLREGFTKALKTQFPSERKKPVVFAFWTFNVVPTDNDRARAAEAKVQLFDAADLGYYEALVSQIGPAARYQFLADVMPGREIPNLELTLPAIKTKIGPYTAYTFSISPDYLLKISYVSHRAKGTASDIDAYQRMLKKSRLRSLRAYITDDGIFPTNIVINVQAKWLHFEKAKTEGDDKTSTLGWLHMRPAYRVAWIIDGQHRLFAYAGHPRAAKSVVSVMAFSGLPASEQARLFVDINAEQRKVKQSLLQELYAELHWDAQEEEVRVRAILSKVIQSLDKDATSPFYQRILKADDKRTPTRCISLTSVFRGLERPGFFIARTSGGKPVEYGPLWTGDNLKTMHRTAGVVAAWFNAIRDQVREVWDLGSAEGGGVAMNDGITACINVLHSVFQHLEDQKRYKLGQMTNAELIEVLIPYATSIGKYFGSMSPEQLVQFRALRGSQGQTTGTKRAQQKLHQDFPDFQPAGLAEFLERERAQTTTQAFEIITHIEKILQRTVIAELKSEFGEAEGDWFFAGVPTKVRKKADDRINDEGGKKGGREDNFDLIDYREIIHDHWELFESLFANGAKGSKDTRTKWLVEVNEARKKVMHASKGARLPITEEELARLAELEEWVTARVESRETGVAAA
jgi:DGQHR domain-containing protein